MTYAVCIGDSITGGSNITALDRYPAVLARLAGYTVYNAGIGGNKTYQMIDRFATDVLARHPDKIFIMGGINDIDTGYTVAQIEANLANMVAQGVASGAHVYLLTITQHNYALANQMRDAINAWIKTQGTANVTIVDAAAAVGNPDSPYDLLPVYDSGDHEHPNAAGALAIAQACCDVTPGPINTWIASAAGIASADANWSLGHAPRTGENVVFDATSVNNCSWDIDKTVAVPNSLCIKDTYTGVYTQPSTVDLAYGPGGYIQANGTATFNNTRAVIDAGSFTQNSPAVITAYYLNLTMITDGSVIDTATCVPHTIHAEANISLPRGMGIGTPTGSGLSVAYGKVLTVPTGSALYWYEYTNCGLDRSGNGNLGIIAGGGTARIFMADLDKTLNLGNISCNFELQNNSSVATANRILKLADGSVLTGNVTLVTDNPTYTITLDLNGHSQSVGVLTVGKKATFKNTGVAATLNATSITLGNSASFIETNIAFDSTKVVGQTLTWIASSAGIASNPANWSLNRTPWYNDTAVFDTTSMNNCSWDYDVNAPFNFVVSTGYTGTVTQATGKKMYLKSLSQADGVVTGNSTDGIYLSGDLVHTGGVTTQYGFNLIIPALATVNVTSEATITLNYLTNYGTVNVLGANEPLRVDKFTNLGVINVAPGMVFHWFGSWSGSTYTNPGVINGPGTMKIDSQQSDFVLDLGVINAPLSIEIPPFAQGNLVFSLKASSPLLGGLNVKSYHASYTVTLDLNGFGVVTKGIAIGARGALLGGEGRIVNSGNLDTSAGTLTPETCTYVSMGGTVKLASGQALYDVEAPGIPLNILSDVPIAHSYKHALPTVLNGHSIPLTHPELEVWLSADQLRGSRTPLIALMGAL